MPVKDNTVRICASRAKSEYKLTEGDLAELSYTSVKNPHYRSAAPMRLYVESEVKVVAEEKRVRLEHEKEHHDELLAERRREAKEARRIAKEAAKGVVTEFARRDDAEEKYSSSVKLPQEVLEKVMVIVADTVETGTDGVRGPGIVVQDILNAGMACWDMNKAARVGLERVGELCLPDDTNEYDWGALDRAVSRPTTLKLTELKQIARDMDAPVSGTKAELVLRILKKFGIDRPHNVPSKCLMAVRKERVLPHHAASALWWNVQRLAEVVDPQSCPDLVGIVRSAHGERIALRTIRQTVAKYFETGRSLRARSEFLIEERRQQIKKIQIEMMRARLERASMPRNLNDIINNNHAKNNGFAGYECECGHMAAKDCAYRLCGNCCVQLRGHEGARCLRHRVGL